MLYNQVIYSKDGAMGYAEYNPDGSLSRYTNTAGATIAPVFDTVVPTSPMITPSGDPRNPVAGEKSWMVATRYTITDAHYKNVAAILNPDGSVQMPASSTLISPETKTVFSQGMTYQQVSFLTGTVQGFQTNDLAGNIVHVDTNGNSVEIGGDLTEVHTISVDVPEPAYAVKLASLQSSLSMAAST